MATTGILDGTDLLMYVDSTAISYSESCTVHMAMATQDVTTKDSNNWTDRKPGIRSFDGSSDGNVALDASYGVDNFMAIYNSRSKVTLKWATNDSGDRFWEGDAYLTDLTITSPKGEPVTFSMSFEGTGKLSFDKT